MAGEELPPVVGVLEGDISGWLDALDEAWGAYEAFAEKMSGQSVDLGGIAAPDMLATGEAMGAQLSEGIAEGTAGLDLAPEVQGALAGAGEAGAVAGDEIAAGIADGAAGAGETAGTRLAAGFDAATAGIGSDAAQRMADEFARTAPDVGNAAAMAFTSTFEAGFAQRISQVGIGSAAIAQLASSFSDGAAEAGGAAGDSLIAALGDSATQGARRAAQQVADGLEAPLTDAAAQAGAAAGGAFDDGFAASVNVSQLVQDALSQANVTGIIAEQFQATGAAEASAASTAITEAVQGTMGSLIVTTSEFLSMSQEQIDAWLGRLGEEAAGGDLEIFTRALERVNTDLTSGTAMTVAQQDAYESLWQSAKEEVDAYTASVQGASEAQLAMAEGMTQKSMTLGLPLGPQPNLPGTEQVPAGIGGGPPIYQIGTPPEMVAQPKPPAGITVPGLGFSNDIKAAGAAAGEVTGELAGVAGAAEGAAGAVGGLGAAMGGPLMWGLMGAVTLLPMLGSMFQGQDQQAQATAQAWQQVTSAISQDSNMIGEHTVAAIQNELITSGAADTLQSYGVSLTDATAAMAGANDAQNYINGSLDAQITNLQSLIQEQSAHSQGVSTDIENEKQQIVQLQATRDAMHQLEADVVAAVQHQNDLTQATLNAEQAAGVWNAEVRAGVLALQQQAQQQNVSAAALGAYDMTLTTGSQAYKDAVNNQAIALANNAIQAQINATALNQSLAPQAQLSGEAIQAALAYQQAGTETGAYTNALTAMYGQYGQASSSLAAANLAIGNLSGTITSGKDAVNLYTQAGDKNFQQFQTAATAIQSYAEKVYEQTGDTQQADAVMQQFAGKLDTAALKAGLTKDQVHELNTELFGVPDVKDINIHLDPTPAEQQMSALDGFIQGEIANINNTPITPTVQGKALAARASGGPVAGGEAYVVGEAGKPEIFVPGADGYITPMDMLTPAGYGAAPAGGAFSYAAQDQPVVVNVYMDGQLVTSGVRTSSQQYKVRNALTGLT